jgi:hypothetical protein
MRNYFRRSGNGPWLLASAIALAVLVAPFAIAAGEGRSVILGKRNPSHGNATKETQIIAKTPANVFGTRQSNLGGGGGAIYGCRALLGADVANPKITTPCMRSSNLSNGEAFQFSGSNGPLIGVIQSGPNFAILNPNAKPFITNATGVATNLNADKLDGKDADQIITEARLANPASAAPSFAFGRVLADGTTDSSQSQGVVNSNITHTANSGIYCFSGMSSNPKNAQVTLDGVPGEISSDTTTTPAPGECPNPNQVEIIVRTYNSAGAPTDKGFQIAVTGGGA